MQALDSRYTVHPGVTMVQAWIASLKEKSGRSLDEWVRLVKSSGLSAEAERAEWLKKNHNMGTNGAQWIVKRAEGRGLEESDPIAYLRAATGWVDAMFAGPRANLRPIYERLLDVGFSMGDDVRVCPARTIVPLYRRHVFAHIRAATRTRIDLGLALPKTPATKRLADTGGLAKGDRITYRLGISSHADIDAEVKRWIKAAYDRAA